MTVHGPADGWVVAPDGRKYWGKAGAAGLLIVDSQHRVLLQHRVAWSHFGGTWGIPGGARQFDESAVDGALRESAEEASVPADALRIEFTSAVDLGFWSYTTVVATARARRSSGCRSTTSTHSRSTPDSPRRGRASDRCSTPASP
ncbi:NUDIX domain-containing protein [Frondihabitans sp. PhB188]|uniref:NUDIX domain-containing protein n=1 Tax=Frondihabitans sp. PhB188 TaxID=2485200 RepID=UPI00351A93C1